ncbi:protein of unknown function [Variovorax sp. CF079]|uniref:DUF1127 domain-containing protein n=1 Tax=Variovorax sp. CF079 TaxID=1882774 RepID=UPI00088D7F74|nr:DUF1127 domain-containing protein [Variovorax sp. CF079]SDC79234.1 protein of unknown function [Variovorax sp. CF079]
MELRMNLPAKEPLQAFIDWFARALTKRRERHQALQLAAMSEHELLDLGIGRSEVPALLNGHTSARREPV